MVKDGVLKKQARVSAVTTTLVKRDHPDKYFFIFFHENLCYRYSLEAPTEALLISTHDIGFIDKKY